MGVNQAKIVQDARIAWPLPGMAGRTFKSALPVPPQWRFARGWLSERGEGFHPFDRWSQIADHL
jgi:hypothetical protein